MSNPPRTVTQLVDARDEGACAVCGSPLVADAPGSRHHRLRRADGGHSASILILLCGSGTTGHHGWAHHNVTKAMARGLIIPAVSRITPQDVPHIPVLTRRGWELHPDEGGFELIPQATALELLDSFNMLTRRVA